jgi:hypothetical protein
MEEDCMRRHLFTLWVLVGMPVLGGGISATIGVSVDFFLIWFGIAPRESWRIALFVFTIGGIIQGAMLGWRVFKAVRE